MFRFFTRERLVILLLMILTPQVAFASGDEISLIFFNLIAAFYPLWITAAVMVLIVAGFALMVAQDENRMAKARTTIVAVIIGGIMATIIWVMGPANFVSILYNGIPGIMLINTGTAVGEETIGVAEWLVSIAVMLGVVFIIVSVLRAVVSFGDEQAYTNVRTTLLHVLVGLIIIASAFILKIVFFDDKEPSALIALIASKVILVLAIITMIAIAVLIYAGVRMIISFGREEEFTKARSLAFRVVIGLIVILVAYTLVFIIATIF